MKYAVAQINISVGDFNGNYKKITTFINKAKLYHADIVVFPEMTITGYPPKDLLLKPIFIKKNLDVLKRISRKTKGIAVVIGFINKIGHKFFNAAAVVQNGKILGFQYKTHLPNYDVFDEKRYFSCADSVSTFNINGQRVGVNICEDIWVDPSPLDEQVRQGASLIINISASPFHVGKVLERKYLLAQRALKNKVPIIYCNLIGGQDDLVYDGNSLVVDSSGRVVAQAKAFDEDLLFYDTNNFFSPINKKLTSGVEELFLATTLGIKDYVKKNRFKKIILGLSGGIDSSVVASLAVIALGNENVKGILMPSDFSSKSSLSDAMELVKNLDIDYSVVPIRSIMKSYMKSLRQEFINLPFNVAEENIQARIRGNILMALSNKFNFLVLSTGNKSEMAVGYCTLYGDMAGGFAPISDLYKTEVYSLASYINRNFFKKNIIPSNIFTKDPSAELRPNQKDSDTLPSYNVLDHILFLYLEKNYSLQRIIDSGFSRNIVRRVINMVDHNEYKRQQAPPGVKVSNKAFGTGRRFPITHLFKN